MAERRRAKTGKPGPVIALTGGIASGKTEVSRRFAALGVPVVDLDQIGRELVRPGQPLLASIARAFGAWVLDASGALDRRRLRDKVFSDPDSRHRLEALMHPRIRLEATRQVAASPGPYCILVIPLLAEAGDVPGIDRVLVVDVQPEVQVERVMRRDDSSRDQALAILAAQASRAERLAIADDLVDNSGTLEELDARVRALHERYLELAEGESD